MRLRSRLRERIVGQPEAIDALVEVYEKFDSNLFERDRPIASLLFLGPTGSGKTLITEAFVESLFFSTRHCIKVDCGEFQHSHEVAKLIGSPPGYLGHRETPPLLTNKRLKALHTEKHPFVVIIFDEIEKASDALWHILLGVLDKGRLTTGSNEEVDLTNTIILMTSNAGTAEMSFALGNGLGFRSSVTSEINDKEVSEVGISAANRKFTSEFINRLDRMITCNALTREQTLQVIDLELARLKEALLSLCVSAPNVRFSSNVKDAVLEEGFDPKYNARNIRRVIEKRIRLKLARIISTKQCSNDESILVGFDQDAKQFTFSALKSYYGAQNHA